MLHEDEFLKPEHMFLKTVHSSVLKNAALRLSRSYKAFFEQECVGFPKFKSWQKQWFSLLYDEPNKSGVFIKGKDVLISLGVDENKKRLEVNAKLRMKIPYKKYKINTFEIINDRGVYYACISVDINKKHDIQSDSELKWVSIDLNHKNLMTVVDYKGESFEFDNPDCLKGFDDRIDDLCSKISKTRKQKVTKIYDKEGNYVETQIKKASRKHVKYKKALEEARHKRQEQIKQLCYSIANWLAGEYDSIFIGDYVPSTDTSTHKNMHRSMLNQSVVGKVRGIIKNVCEKSYKKFKKVDENNTSKRCSVCGDMKSKDPSIREFKCEKCGTLFHRDINSCCNFAVNEGVVSKEQILGFDLVSPTHKIKLTKKNLKVSSHIMKSRWAKAFA